MPICRPVFPAGRLCRRAGPIYYLGWAISAGVLLIEHRLIAADDLSRINVAFFMLNGLVAALLGLAAIAAVFFAR